MSSANGKLVVWVGGLDSWDSLRDSCLGVPLKSQTTNLPSWDTRTMKNHLNKPGSQLNGAGLFIYSLDTFREPTCREIHHTMGTYVSFIFSGYNLQNPYFDSLKPSFFPWVFGGPKVHFPCLKVCLQNVRCDARVETQLPIFSYNRGWENQPKSVGVYIYIPINYKDSLLKVGFFPSPMTKELIDPMAHMLIEAISPVSVCSSRGMYYIALGHMKPGQEWMGEDT